MLGGRGPPHAGAVPVAPAACTQCHTWVVPGQRLTPTAVTTVGYLCVGCAGRRRAVADTAADTAADAAAATADPVAHLPVPPSPPAAPRPRTPRVNPDADTDADPALPPCVVTAMAAALAADGLALSAAEVHTHLRPVAKELAVVAAATRVHHLGRVLACPGSRLSAQALLWARRLWEEWERTRF